MEMSQQCCTGDWANGERRIRVLGRGLMSFWSGACAGSVVVGDLHQLATMNNCEGLIVGRIKAISAK